MSRTEEFVKNALCLASVSVLIRAVSVSFNAYISSRIGAEGMGLFSLVMSVYGFAVCVACSGINLAATRLCAKAAVSADAENIVSELKKTVKSCMLYSLFFGTAAGAAVFFGAELIGTHLLSDARTVPSLRALGVCLPAVSMSSALSGYFTGVRRAKRNAAVMICGQMTLIFSVTAGLVFLLPRGMTWACFAVVLGSSLSEGISFLFSWILYKLSLRRTVKELQISARDTPDGSACAYAKTPAAVFGRLKPEKASEKKKTKLEGMLNHLPGKFGEICSISVPVAIGSYLRQGLVSLEHIAIMWGLRRFGSSSAQALSSYGTLHSMAMPVVMFPYAVISAFTSLLIPEMTSFAERGEFLRARRVSRRVIGTTVFCGIGACGVFMTFWYELGTAVYSSAEAGQMIRLMAPVLPMMFLDTTVDAMLKGLGEHVYCMKVNTADAVTSLLLVLLLVPHIGIYGYVAVIYVSEAVNASMSLSRLSSITETGMDFVRFVLLPVLSLAFAGICYPVFEYAALVLCGIELGLGGIIVYAAIYCAPAALYYMGRKACVKAA